MPDDFIGAFSGRKHKNMSLTYGETAGALANRGDFLGKLGIDYRHLVCAEQVHANLVVRVREEHRGKGALDFTGAISGADGLITAQQGLPLAVLTADCLPVLLYDPRAPAAGIVHAGWRGSRAEIIVQAIRLMQGQFNTRPGDLRLLFGPCIRGCCYEVGSDLAGIFEREILQREQRFFLDLAALNRRQALEAGAQEGNIRDSGICTCCRDSEYFSFRREGAACGRMISVAMLRREGCTA